jgi:uncharacterized protein YndB with AHSA1/START domain
MATNSITINAPVDRVYGVLADGHSYAEWVVGAKRIRGVDPHWPAIGSKFHHSVGVGPLTIDDESEVLDVEPQRRLKLRVRARPAGEAHVTLTLTAAGGGNRTNVEMEEHPVRGLAMLVGRNPIADRLLARRNDEALRRLKNRAEDDRA